MIAGLQSDAESAVEIAEAAPEQQMLGVAAGVPPGGVSAGKRTTRPAWQREFGRQDAALYGSQDGRRYACWPALSAHAKPLGMTTVQTHFPPVVLLGVPVDHLTMPDALACIERMIASRRPHYVVTANA